MRGRLTAWLFAGLLPISPAVAEDAGKTWMATGADGNQYEVHPATPGYAGDTGLFHVSSAYTLPKGKAAGSIFRDNLDRDPKDLDLSIHGVNAAYGVSDKFEIFAQIGLQNRADTDAAFQTGYVNDFPFSGGPWETGFGDIRIGAKYGFLSDYKKDPVGLAVKAAVKLPTADETKGLGTGKVSFGADLVLSKSLSGKADIHGQIGFESNSDPDGLNIGNAMRLGAGVNIPACSRFQVQAEMLYTSYSGGDDEDNQTNPLDVVVGPVIFFKTGWFIRPAISWNFNFDDRGLDSSMQSWTGKQISVGYHPGYHCHRIAEATPTPAPTPPPSNRPPTVACDVDKSSIAPGDSVHCRATGSDPDGDALTYEWSASAGKVSGSGNQATWDSAGVSAGSTVTITVRVSDGRGGTAESKCTVRLDKARDIAQTTCTAGSFPANSNRLNNVDKACLDDVASRLKQDPRAHVVIIGHADSKEKYPEVIGRKRAEAVKTYLVKERGIDESRISVRSAAGRKPADTGTSPAARAKNRRVEVVVVPEGAELPE